MEIKNNDDGKHEISRFPDYWFDEDGTPYRKKPVKRGTGSGTFVVTSFSTTMGETAYKIYDQRNKRTSVLKRSLAQAIQDQEIIFALEPLIGYPNYFVDIDGQPYCLKPSGALRKCRIEVTPKSERFIIYDKRGRRRSHTAKSLLRLAREGSSCIL